ncbi:MAG: VOC family protein [Pseudomonadota bacterium]
MFSHVLIGSSDIRRSETFYNTVLGVLGAKPARENMNATGQLRLFYRHAGSIFGISEPINGEASSVANGSTIGFACNSAEQVKEFHDVAVANGATSIEQPPGLRQDAVGEMHLCYFRDPDGHKICGMYRPG